MNTGKIEYVNLEELSHTDYKIVDGQADITRWPVVDENATSIGRVRDLLFDPAHNAVRYIIIDLDNTDITEEEKAVLIPIGYANLATQKKEVIIPVMKKAQYDAMPRYIIGEVTRETEKEIRSAIGSPAALEIEEEIVEMDHADFYRHHHFDRGNIISNGAASSLDANHLTKAPTIAPGEGNKTIESIEYAKTANFGAPTEEIKPTGEHEQFDIDVDGRAFNIEPQENGTYRIFDNEEKIGVIYAEAGERGVQWRTMDQLDDRLVEVLGETITRHNSLK